MNFPSQEQVELFRRTPGAISVCEMVALSYLAELAPRGTCIDLGSNAGKAAMSAAVGIARSRDRGTALLMIDPVFDLENKEAWSRTVGKRPENTGWGWIFAEDFLEKASSRISEITDGSVIGVPVGDYSEHALGCYGDYAWVFVDTDDHREELIRSEVAIIEQKIVKGGIIAFHDFGNYPAVERVMRGVLEHGFFEEIYIPWDEIRAHVSSHNLEAGNDSWHCCEEVLPCHVAAIRRKVDLPFRMP